jgi:hypothetical protein
MLADKSLQGVAAHPFAVDRRTQRCGSYADHSSIVRAAWLRSGRRGVNRCPRQRVGGAEITGVSWRQILGEGRLVRRMPGGVGSLLLKAQGKPTQAFGVALHEHGNVATLLLSSEGNQPIDILGPCNLILLDLDDEIVDAQSGLCRSAVLGNLRHQDTLARRVIYPCQAPAWAGSGGKSGCRRCGVGYFLDGRRDNQRFVIAPYSQADDCAWWRPCDRTCQRCRIC